MNNPSLLQAAKLVAIPVPLAFAGYQFAFSQNAIPGILDLPSETSTPIFKNIFNRGLNVILPGSIVSTTATAYLAYVQPARRQLWGFAMGCQILVPLLTSVVMSKGIHRLIDISESKTMQEKATANLEARQLLIRWVKMNYVRAVLWLAAGVAGIGAALA